MATFTALNNKTRQYVNNETGEIISRRQYLKIKRGGISNETNAKLNALKNPELAISRPARGRASLLKKTETERELIAQARLEEKIRKAEIAAEKKKEKELERILKKAGSKKPVKRMKVTNRLLKAGRMGRRLPFQTYDDYVEMYKEAKALRTIIAYGLGMEGYHSSTGEHVVFTVFPMAAFDHLLTEDEFEDGMQDALDERSYFEFTNYFMHLAFKKEYARDKAIKSGLKWKDSAHVKRG